MSLMRESLTEKISGFKDFMGRFRRHIVAIICLGILIFLGVIAIFADVVAPYPPRKMSLYDKNQPPNSQHLFGTDRFGRDILSRVIWGTRTSFMIGLLAVGMSATIGTFVGSVAGYAGGVIDEILMRIVDIFLILPTFFLILIIVAMFGAQLFFVVMVIGLTYWPTTARLVRAEFLTFKNREFVKAAKASGAGSTYIIFKEILPNAIFAVVIQATLMIGGAIITEASLSFLGLGDPRTISWGMMLNDAMYTLGVADWNAFFPGLFLTIVILAFNQIGDGINDALNPYLREMK